MVDVAPQARAAWIVWALLLRHWRKLDGLRTSEIAEVGDMTWEGAWTFMTKLTNVGYEHLPIFQRRDVDSMPWVCNFYPHDLSPVEAVNPAQKAAIVAHRMISRNLLLPGEEWGRQKVASLVGITPAVATVMLNRMSGARGLPMYADRGKWVLDLGNFSTAFPYDSDIPQVGCGILYQA